MVAIDVTDEDLKSLGLKADFAYATLKSALKSEPSLISSAACLYTHDLGALLSRLTISSTASIINLRKGGKRANPLEKFILQCILMHKIYSEYDDGNYSTSLISDPDDGLLGLKVYLQADDDPQHERSELFKLIQNRAADLRNDGRYDIILEAIKYVRERYSSDFGIVRD